MDNNDQTPESVADAKMRSATDKAYMKALRMTEPSPKMNPRDAVRGQRGYSKGGSASSRADGIAQRGKTKGTIIMCGGGMAKGKK
jgi:hypothetical protein